MAPRTVATGAKGLGQERPPEAPPCSNKRCRERCRAFPLRHAVTDKAHDDAGRELHRRQRERHQQDGENDRHHGHDGSGNAPRITCATGSAWVLTMTVGTAVSGIGSPARAAAASSSSARQQNNFKTILILNNNPLHPNDPTHPFIQPHRTLAHLLNGSITNHSYRQLKD